MAFSTGLIEEFRKQDILTDVLFLVADDETLLKRYGETRRRHPLADQASALRAAIKTEREILAEVINAADLSIVSNAVKISSNGKHIVGWTAVDGYFGSFKITLDQLYVCEDGKSQRVGYPGAGASHLATGATLGLCEADLPLQYR